MIDGNGIVDLDEDDLRRLAEFFAHLDRWDRESRDNRATSLQEIHPTPQA